MGNEKDVAILHVAEGDGGSGAGRGESSGSSSAQALDTGDTTKEKPQSSVRLAMLFAGMAIAVFCGALDGNMVAPALPSITDSLGSAADEGWYGTAYYLTLSCCQLAWAQIYKAFPAKRVFFGAFLIFQLGCLIAALAQRSVVLIIGRAVSGAGISGSFVGSLIIVSYIVPLRWRPIMTAFFSILIGSTQTAGPVLGGVLTSRLSWPWCFWINLPLGGLSILLALFGAATKDPESRRGGRTTRQLVRDFDVKGFVLWIPAVVCLTLILQFGGVRYAWSSGPLIALYVITPLLFAAFVVVQVRGGDKVLAPVHIVKQRSLACAALYTLFMQAAKSHLSWFMPIFFQAVQGVTAIESGVHTIPGFLSYVCFQILTSLSISWLGLYTPFMLAGSTISTLGTALLSTMTVSTSPPNWIGYQILAWSGFAMGYNGPQIAAQTVFQDSRDTPTALTIITTCQDLGGGIGNSIGSAIYNDVVRRALQVVLPGLTTAQISQAGITGLLDLVAADQRYEVAEAYAKGVRGVFHASTALAGATLVLACFVEWRNVRNKTEAPRKGNEEATVKEKS